MSQQLISLSPDLKHLRDEGYSINVTDGYLVVGDIPYVTSERKVQTDGVIVSSLQLAGDKTEAPNDHTVYFAGQKPCDKNGSPLNITCSETHQRLTTNLSADFQFSRKPSPLTNPPYANYYDKITTYVTILEGPARAIDSSVDARTFPVITDDSEKVIFKYLDNASSRAGIAAIADKLRVGSLAIVGLGGTGSYILDLVAKTPVQNIHLFDGDTFHQHNAFRAPGAASVEQLTQKLMKVDYFSRQYEPMRHGLAPHAAFLNETNVDELTGMDFVFLCIDDGPAKKLIVDALERSNIPFIDTGLGVQEIAGSLTGLIRTTASTAETREAARRHISFSDDDAEQEYAHNIQVADLNALNATLAVIKWKKLCGFYQDIKQEQHAIYEINSSYIVREGGISEDD